MSDKMKVALIPNDFSMDLEQVFQLCQQENVKYVELAYMWGKSILDLSEAELARVHELMDSYGLKTASIQTQIMKVFPPGSKLAKPGSQNMHRDFEFNISRIDTAIDRAKEFKTDYIVTYSFFRYLSEVTEKNWQLLLDIYGKFLPKLKAANKTAVVECEGDTYVGTINDYLRLFQHFNSPYIQANFDMSNLHAAQSAFTREDFDRFYSYVPYFHVKDRRFRKILKFLPQAAVFSQGSIPWKKVLPWFAEKGFSGFLSVEPHVHGKNKFELGRQCVKNLQALLQELKINFE